MLYFTILSSPSFWLYSELQHLGCDYNCDSPTPYQDMAIRTTRNLYIQPDPTKLVQFPGQNEPPDKRPQHLENQVFCRKLEHP